jgi:hypothetical protein
MFDFQHMEAVLRVSRVIQKDRCKSTAISA